MTCFMRADTLLFPALRKPTRFCNARFFWIIIHSVGHPTLQDFGIADLRM